MSDSIDYHWALCVALMRKPPNPYFHPVRIFTPKVSQHGDIFSCLSTFLVVFLNFPKVEWAHTIEAKIWLKTKNYTLKWDNRNSAFFQFLLKTFHKFRSRHSKTAQNVEIFVSAFFPNICILFLLVFQCFRLNFTLVAALSSELLRRI